MGEELRKNLIKTERETEFRLTSDGNCPFLTERGLCRLLEVGDESLLCEICSQHPRFYGSVNGREYCGLGLSCEAAVGLLLSPGPLRFADGQAGRIFRFGALCSAVGLRLSPSQVRFSPVTDPKRLDAWFALLRACEPIDEEWLPSVGRAYAALPEYLSAVSAFSYSADCRSMHKIYQYIFYRRFGNAKAYSAAICARFARLSASYILLEAIRTGDIAESVRRWSEEIEYSDENVTYLLSALQRDDRSSDFR